MEAVTSAEIGPSQSFWDGYSKAIAAMVRESHNGRSFMTDLIESPAKTYRGFPISAPIEPGTHKVEFIGFKDHRRAIEDAGRYAHWEASYRLLGRECDVIIIDSVSMSAKDMHIGMRLPKVDEETKRKAEEIARELADKLTAQMFYGLSRGAQHAAGGTIH